MSLHIADLESSYLAGRALGLVAEERKHGLLEPLAGGAPLLDHLDDLEREGHARRLGEVALLVVLASRCCRLWGRSMLRPYTEDRGTRNGSRTNDGRQ